MNRIILPSRQTGKNYEREQLIDAAALALLFEAGGEMAFAELWQAMPATRREIWRSLNRQYTLGNIKRHREGEPIILTSSAKTAMAAARFPLQYAQEKAA